jgi:DNA invertase Pin-like site-specific DNA recombinase
MLVNVCNPHSLRSPVIFSGRSHAEVAKDKERFVKRLTELGIVSSKDVLTQEMVQDLKAEFPAWSAQNIRIQKKNCFQLGDDFLRPRKNPNKANNPEFIAQVQTLVQQGSSCREIAEQLNSNLTTVNQVIRTHSLTRKPPDTKQKTDPVLIERIRQPSQQGHTKAQITKLVRIGETSLDKILRQHNIHLERQKNKKTRFQKTSHNAGKSNGGFHDRNF